MDNIVHPKVNAKEIAVIAALVLTLLVLCLWIFPIVGDDTPTTMSATSQLTTAQPVTAVPTAPTTVPTTNYTPVTYPDTSNPPTTAEIAKMYCDAVNGFKAYTQTVSVDRTQTVSIEVSNLPDSIASMVNKIISGLTGTEQTTIVFPEGVATSSADLASIPEGRNAEIDPAGLASAKAEDLSDGGKKITLTFVAETAYYDGKTNVSEPTYHKGAMDPIDFSTVNLGPIEVTGINIEYPGATVVATTDTQGRLTALHCDLPFGGDFNAKAMGAFDVALGMDCSMVTDWVMTYS